MDFRFSPEEDAFRGRIQTFLKESLPADWSGVYPDAYFHDEYWSFVRAFTTKMAEKGWLTLPWPREYGGQALPIMQQVVLTEELSYHRAPYRDVMMGIQLVGPTLMIHGTPEQKARWLPPIAAAKEIWCQGFSEPGSGSDLASLQTRAERDGDDYVVNGSKIWTSGAHRSDNCILLTRTDPNAPKHKGISAFILPMDTPGITIRPILNPLNVHYFNQVFFDNVRIPKANIIGDENRGWYVATTTLDFERSGVGSFATNQRTLDELAMLAKDTPWRGRTAADNPVYRHALAEVAIANHAGTMIAYRVASMQGQGLVPNNEASASKLLGSEIQQKIAAVGVRLLGLYGQIDRHSRYAPIQGRIMAEYLHAIPATIRGGTSEGQRNIIATRGLGLPRA